MNLGVDFLPTGGPESHIAELTVAGLGRVGFVNGIAQVQPGFDWKIPGDIQLHEHRSQVAADRKTVAGARIESMLGGRHGAVDCSPIATSRDIDTQLWQSRVVVPVHRGQGFNAGKEEANVEGNVDDGIHGESVRHHDVIIYTVEYVRPAKTSPVSIVAGPK